MGLSRRVPGGQGSLVGRAFALALSLAVAPLATAGDRTCADAYFGVTGEPDRVEAYACFDELRRGTGDPERSVDFPVPPHLPLVVMRLNGEGAERDAGVAAALLREWRDASAGAEEQRLQLTRLVLERQSGLGAAKPPRIELCGLAGDDAYRRACRSVEDRRFQARQDRWRRALAEDVSPAARAELGALWFALAGYRTAERERLEQAAPLERDSDEHLGRWDERVLADFERAVEALLRGPDPPAGDAVTAEQRRVAEEALRLAVDRDRDERAAAFRAYARALPDAREDYERRARRYDDAARTAHAAWERYRDAWVVVVRAQAEEEANAAERSARAHLARQRERVLASREQPASAAGS